MKKELKRINNNIHNFELENFNGPLDLLLHLAKTNELEISTISLDLLIDQYLDFIELVKEHGIEVQSSYLEMAAELIRLKSQMLLPHLHDNLEFEEELASLEMDRETLIDKLLEYKKYKQITQELESLSSKREHIYMRPATNLSGFKATKTKEGFTISEFFNAVKNLVEHDLHSKKSQRVLNISEVDIDQYINDIRQITVKTNIQNHINTMSRYQKIGFFMGLLESLKLQYITGFFEDDNYYIIPKEQDEITT